MSTANQLKSNHKKRMRRKLALSRRTRPCPVNMRSGSEFREFPKFRLRYKPTPALKQEREKPADLIAAVKAARKSHFKMPIGVSDEIAAKAFEQELNSAIEHFVPNTYLALLGREPITGELGAESPKKLMLEEYYKKSSSDDFYTLVGNYQFINRKKWPEKEQTLDLSWVQSADLILNRLVDSKSTADEISTAILFAEVQAFDETQTAALLMALRKFIGENRFAQTDEIVTVLGAAIRKFAMNMKQSDFGTFAAWMMPSDTRRVHHDTELELAKGALWRVKFGSLLAIEDFSQLIQGLRGVASDYLNPRVILDKNYASIARLAITATFAMEVWMKNLAESEKLHKLSVAMRLAWFLEAVDLEVRRVVESLESRDSQFAERLRERWLQISTRDA